MSAHSTRKATNIKAGRLCSVNILLITVYWIIRVDIIFQSNLHDFLLKDLH